MTWAKQSALMATACLCAFFLYLGCLALATPLNAIAEALGRLVAWLGRWG